jgi:uncharacterized protein YabN with tetrapyrrole methylase and pyrophosphatase domain
VVTGDGVGDYGEHGRAFPADAPTSACLRTSYSITGKVRPSPADPQVSSIALFIVGSGLRQADHLTVEGLRALKTCEIIYSFIPAEFAHLLPDGLSMKVQSLRDLFRDGVRRGAIYKEAVDLIWHSADRHSSMAYLTVGNPVVFDSVTAGLLARSQDGQHRVHLVAGISAVDAVMVALGRDYAPGIQVFDASSLVAHGIAPRTDIACVLLQPDLFGTSALTLERGPDDEPLAPLRDHLLGSYPTEHEVTFVTCGGASSSDTRLDTFVLCELSRAERFPAIPGASLFIPPVVPLEMA